jgi:iron-regulated transporter 1
VADPSQTSVLSGSTKFLAFLAILVFGIVENLSRKANLLSIERDWVPILAPAVILEASTQYDLAHVNAIMARIDIGSKLIAPIAVSGLGSVVSAKTSVAVVAASNVVGFGLELWTARRVWENSANLRFAKSSSLKPMEDQSTYSISSRQRLGLLIFKAGSTVALWWRGYVESFHLYFSFGAWRASLAMTMTQISILSVTGVLVVFLLNSGFSLKVLTIAEALSTLFELGSTIITPLTITRLTPRSLPDVVDEVFDERGEELSNEESASIISADHTKAAVTKIGFLGIVYMLATLVSSRTPHLYPNILTAVQIPTLPMIFYLTSTLSYPIPQSTESPTFFNHTVASLMLFFCLAASRLGRGIFSLTTQQLSQSQVPASLRSSFGGTELVFVSIFGLFHNIGAAIFSEPSQFGWLASGSVFAIAASVAMFVWFMSVENISLGGWRFWENVHGYEAVALEPVQESDQGPIGVP